LIRQIGIEMSMTMKEKIASEEAAHQTKMRAQNLLRDKTEAANNAADTAKKRMGDFYGTVFNPSIAQGARSQARLAMLQAAKAYVAAVEQIPDEPMGLSADVAASNLDRINELRAERHLPAIAKLA
jgi:transketolase